MAAIVGRELELGRLEAVLGQVAGGAGPAGLLIEGPAGIGKSTLWQAAVDAARSTDWTVLAARAVASESRLTLGVLADVLASVDTEVVASLPAPQRHAIDVALLRVEAQPDGGAPVEGRVLGTALRGVLDRLVRDRPVLLAIDDVQWADPASAAAIAFAVRRLDAIGVALLVARRTPLPLPFAPEEILPRDRWTTIDVGPMSLGAINELLRQHAAAPPSRPTLVRIQQASGGNPLFAIEIARVLEAKGEPPAGEPLPVPSDVRELLRDRLASAPATVRAVLLDLAILGAADDDRLAAVEGRPVGADLGVADAEGLLRRDGPSVAFAHPLYAAAALAAASPAERRAAHRRVAETAASPEERARNLAMATDGPDPGIATALEDAALEARSRAAPLAAAELLRLAIERTPANDVASAARRRLLLGEELQRAGDMAAALVELQAVAGGSDIRARARARLVMASIRYETDGSTAAAVQLATAALSDAQGDPALEAHAYAVLAAVDWDDLAGHARYVEEGLRRLAEVPQPDPLTEGLLVLVRCGADVSAGLPLDPALVERGLELERIAPAPTVSDRFSASLGTWLKWLDQFEDARLWLERTRQTAIDEGDEGSLPYALGHLPELEVWTGNWERADAVAREHLAAAEASGLAAQRDQALYNLALVHVHQGRVELARAEIAEALATTAATGDDYMRSGVLPHLGLLELSLGNWAAAAAALEEALAMRTALGAVAPWRPGPDLVEALIGAGSLERARTVQEELDRRLPDASRTSSRASAARSRGLLLAASGDLEAARTTLESALGIHDAAPIAFDRARTLLALGQVLRRLRARGAAAHAFREAHATFERLGAQLWVERAAAELERTGLRRSAGPELTESERRVAELAASGMTNRAVAAALFMSPKTVDANLGRAYAKLGIRSRAELGAAIRGGAVPADPSGAPSANPRANGPARRTNMGDRRM
ncbi:MAG TPA: LuxR family transcriptional regulator [Candidatus Limnocylindrales bacterium]